MKYLRTSITRITFEYQIETIMKAIQSIINKIERTEKLCIAGEVALILVVIVTLYTIYL